MATPTGPQIYPGASTTHWYGDSYSGDRMDVNAVVWHSTEGTSLPDYEGGATAPTITAVPDFDARKLRFFQHFRFDVSARALVNRPGGVETNTLNVAQVEIVGTCDPATHKKWGKTPHLYMPELPDWAVRDLAAFVTWAHDEHGVPLTSGVTFKAYPGSYGADNGVRLTFDKWNAFEGHLGHMHAPENCVTPDTPILMGDMTWKTAGDLVTGDRIVGFDEDNTQVGSTAGRRFREALATVHGRATKDCYEVVTSDGRTVVASADHKWLVNLPYVNRGSRVAWVETASLAPGKHRARSVGAPWSESHSREAAWVAGAIDCDGAIVFNKSGDSQVLFGQSEGRADVMDRFRKYLTDTKREWYEATRTNRAGFKGQEGFVDLRVKGGLWETVRLLVETGPEKFESVRDNCWVNRVVGKTAPAIEILSVRHVGPREVVSLESSTRTYVANGLLCHNTHGDPGAFPMRAILNAAKPVPPKAPAAPRPPSKPPSKPVVSLKHVVAAARRDPGGRQGATTHKVEVRLVEDALVKLGYLNKRWADGSFGTYTVAAYARLQRHLGYAGAAADGIPGSHSLTWLGLRTGLFTKAD